MRNNLLLIGLVNLCLSSSAYALSPDKFKSLEYHVNTGVANTLPYAAQTLTPEFKEKFSFINFEEDEDSSIKLVTYIDTPSRVFKEQSINIRVREHMTKPRKSKITVKLRAANPEAFGDVTDYRKAEIDYTKGRAAYSVSYDFPYSPADLNIKQLDFTKIFDILKTNPVVWEMVGELYEANKDELAQTLVMRTHSWEGHLKDQRFDDLEIDFQQWTPYYRQPRVSFTEFSFKGKSRNEARLKQAYDYLSEQIHNLSLDDAGNQGSKTKATFEMSKAFN